MADLRWDHYLEFDVEAAHWDTAERYAANRIRAYTRELKTGPDKVPDAQVLRNAEFRAVPVDGSPTLWRITVRVTV